MTQAKPSAGRRGDPVALGIFSSRIAAICDEMGAVLRRSSLSPNIKDRLDFSCAVFDREGRLCAQAAHIPVHLGSMAYAMADVVGKVEWAPGDAVILNDPFLGGTHLPDVTVLTPVYSEDLLAGFVANRAHHADIGAESPGSMPLSRCLEDEGVVIPPTHLARDGIIDAACMSELTGGVRNCDLVAGDFVAQVSANRAGARRLEQLVARTGRLEFERRLGELNDYAASVARAALDEIPAGRYTFEDFMDDDGAGTRDIPLRVSIQVRPGRVDVDFSGTAGQVPGNVNCPLSVAAAGVYYVFRCLMPSYLPDCAGSFRGIHLHAPEGSLLNARRPAAVAAGNVETSSRVVDLVCGALSKALPDRLPAASQGTMNNTALGATAGGDVAAWDYYETIAGGMGAGPAGGGLSGVQTHMTNTRNTPAEVLELLYPVRVRCYELRRGSGGTGRRPGGEGIVRELEFLADTEFTLLTERRSHRPWGLSGGGPGAAGENFLNGEQLPAKVHGRSGRGQRLLIRTPGGGGWGAPRS